MGVAGVAKALHGAWDAGKVALETKTGLKGFQLGAIFWGGANAFHTLHDKSLDPRERRKEALTGIAITALTLGFKTPGSQWAAGVALNLTPHLPGMARAMVGSYRSALESRSMAAIPFSYSSAPMDIAYQSMQYGMSRINDARQYQGSEAAMYAAKYISGKYITKTSVY